MNQGRRTVLCMTQPVARPLLIRAGKRLRRVDLGETQSGGALLDLVLTDD